MSTFADLVGVPFEIGGRGPKTYDCYGLVREMYRRVHGIDMPTHMTHHTQGHNQGQITLVAQSEWDLCSKQEHVAVVFWIGRFVSHIGFVLPGDRFIHAWEGSGGVTVERLSDWEHRIAGFYDYRR